MKRKKQTLAGLRRERDHIKDGWRQMAARVYTAENALAEARKHVEQLAMALGETKILLAQSQGYIQRVHVVEGRAEVKLGSISAGPLTDDVILKVRDELANGDEKRAHQILDMINPSELLDRATGKVPGEEPQDLFDGRHQSFSQRNGDWKTA